MEKLLVRKYVRDNYMGHIIGAFWGDTELQSILDIDDKADTEAYSEYRVRF